MTTDDIDAVIAGLTERQRNFALSMEPGRALAYRTVNGHTRVALFSKGIIFNAGTDIDWVFALTPLGEQIRAHLQKQEPQIAPTSAQR